MKKLTRFLLGFVRIKVTGAFPERFLNLCGTERLPFWDVERTDGGTLLLTIPLLGQNRSKVLAKKAFCEVEILHRQGLPFFIWNLRGRYALFLGMMGAFLGAVFLSQLILVVDVTGNSTVCDSVILTELEKIGLGVGSYGPAVNVRRVANRALMDLPELSFLTVNISGVRAEVVVREAVELPEVEERWERADIVAQTDGVILDIDPLIGHPVVSEGEAVLKGEVLISGTKEHHSGDGSGQVIDTTEVRAEGRVMAQTRRVLHGAAPISVAVKGEKTSTHTLWTINFFKNAVKIGSDGSIPPSECDKITVVYPLTLPTGITLPVSLSKTTVTVHEQGERQAERRSLEHFLEQALEAHLTELVGEEGQVLSRKTTFSERDGVLYGELEAACVEQLGVRR